MKIQRLLFWSGMVVYATTGAMDHPRSCEARKHLHERLLAARRAEIAACSSLIPRIEDGHFLSAVPPAGDVSTFVVNKSLEDIECCAAFILLQHEVMMNLLPIYDHNQKTKPSVVDDVSESVTDLTKRWLAYMTPLFCDADQQLLNGLSQSYDSIVMSFASQFRAYLYPGFAFMRIHVRKFAILEKIIKQRVVDQAIVNDFDECNVQRYEILAWYKLYQNTIVAFYNELITYRQKLAREAYEELMQECAASTSKKGGKHKKHTAHVSAQTVSKCEQIEEAVNESPEDQITHEGLDAEDVAIVPEESVSEASSEALAVRMPVCTPSGFPALIEYAQRTLLWHVDIEKALKQHGDVKGCFWAIVKHRLPLILEREYAHCARQGRRKKTATCLDRMFYFDGWIEVFGGTVRIPGTFELALGPDGLFYHRFFRVDREHMGMSLPDLPVGDAREVRFSRAGVHTTYLVSETEQYVAITEQNGPYNVRYVIRKTIT